MKNAWVDWPYLRRGTTRVWNTAVSLDGLWGDTPEQAVELERRAWEKLWVVGPPAVSSAGCW